jgi:hypothetical protein
MTRANLFTGKWLITEMSEWDADYFNDEVRAYIEIERDGRGRFQFGYVDAYMDGKIVDHPNGKRFEFSWEGHDENDPANGFGWVGKKFGEVVEGEIRIHNGDDSTFVARRSEGR